MEKHDRKNINLIEEPLSRPKSSKENLEFDKSDTKRLKKSTMVEKFSKVTSRDSKKSF